MSSNCHAHRELRAVACRERYNCKNTCAGMTFDSPSWWIGPAPRRAAPGEARPGARKLHAWAHTCSSSQFHVDGRRAAYPNLHRRLPIAICVAVVHVLERDSGSSRWESDMATRAIDFAALHADEPPHLAAARAAAYAMPLAELDLLDTDLWVNDTHWPYFERLRDESPVHYHANGRFGPYWSVTRYADIMAVDTDHARFSSDAHLGGITAKDMDDDFILPMFIAMDPPKHDVQRKAEIGRAHV